MPVNTNNNYTGPPTGGCSLVALNKKIKLRTRKD